MAITDISQLTPAVEITPDAGMPSNVAGFFRVVKGNETAENAPTCENCSYFDFDDNLRPTGLPASLSTRRAATSSNTEPSPAISERSIRLFMQACFSCSVITSLLSFVNADSLPMNYISCMSNFVKHYFITT